MLMQRKPNDTSVRQNIIRQELIVAEMGDRGHNRHGPKIGLGAVPFFLGGGELGPHLTQSRLGRGLPPYQVVS